MKCNASVLPDYWQLNLHARNNRVEIDLEREYFSFLLHSVVLNNMKTTPSFLYSV